VAASKLNVLAMTNSAHGIIGFKFRDSFYTNDQQDWKWQHNGLWDIAKMNIPRQQIFPLNWLHPVGLTNITVDMGKNQLCYVARLSMPPTPMFGLNRGHLD